MTKIIIIDHDEHCAYFEELTDEMLEKYDGNEQAYIDDNYNIENMSWDYITDIFRVDENGDIEEINV